MKPAEDSKVFNRVTTQLPLHFPLVQIMIVLSMVGSLKQQKMEIPPILFYGVCCAISVIFSLIGLDVERTFSDSVPRIVMFVFEYIFVLSCWNSLIYSIAFHPHLDIFTGYFEDKMLRVADPTNRSIFIFSKTNVRKWVDFAVGTAGTIVFQYFCRISCGGVAG